MTPFELFQRHVHTWKDCQQCPLGRQRDRIVLARGSVPADVLLIGEAPGESENVIGQPFVGPAGKLLDRIVQNVFGRTALRIAYTNIVACFPKDAKHRGDNEPTRAEIEACQERLLEFIHIVEPRLIVCVGKLATVNVYKLFGFDGPLERPGWLLDKQVEYAEISHPAWILRLPVVQQGFEIQKSCVILRNSLERLQTPISF